MIGTYTGNFVLVGVSVGGMVLAGKAEKFLK